MLTIRSCNSAAMAMTVSLALANHVRADVVDFEDLVVGTIYMHDDVFTSNGVDITVTTFFFFNGVPTDNGFSEVEDGGNALGSGNELEVNNVNLDFDFGAELTNLSVLFGEFGGNLNLEVNGDFANIDEFCDLPPTLGGVDIMVVDIVGSNGRLTLNGSINSFAVGGQELWIDDVVFRPILPDCGNFPCGNNNNKVLICHVPPGNPANEHTLCISPNALDAHLENHEGDHCGPCEEPSLLGDLGGDGTVGMDDFLMLLGAWGPCDACPADLDLDSIVGLTDLLILLGNWG